MLETSQVERKYTQICSFKKYTFKNQDPLNFSDDSIFCKKSAFLAKNGTFTIQKAIV